MTKVLALYDMFLESLDNSTYKMARKGTVLELISCKYDYTRRGSSYSITLWKVAVSIEDEVFLGNPFVEHRTDAPMEERSPFIYLEN